MELLNSNVFYILKFQWSQVLAGTIHFGRQMHQLDAQSEVDFITKLKFYFEILQMKLNNWTSEAPEF